MSECSFWYGIDCMIFKMKSLIYCYAGAITNHGQFINLVESIVGMIFFPQLHRYVLIRCWWFTFFSSFLISFSIFSTLSLSLCMSNFGILFCILLIHHTIFRSAWHIKWHEKRMKKYLNWKTLCSVQSAHTSYFRLHLSCLTYVLHSACVDESALVINSYIKITLWLLSAGPMDSDF